MPLQLLDSHAAVLNAVEISLEKAFAEGVTGTTVTLNPPVAPLKDYADDKKMSSPAAGLTAVDTRKLVKDHVKAGLAAFLAAGGGGAIGTPGNTPLTLETAMATFAPLVHDHNTLYYTKDESDGLYALKHEHPYAPSVHAHDDLYYTETEADARFAPVHEHPYEPLGTLHDDRYYTETESDARFEPKGTLHDGRYYTKTESDTRFVNVAGDTMTGALTINAGLTVDTNTLVVDATNDRVGVGTTTPGRTFEVVSALGASPVGITNTNAAGYSAIAFNNTTGTAKGFVGYGNTGVAAPQTNAFYLQHNNVDFVLFYGDAVAVPSTQREELRISAATGNWSFDSGTFYIDATNNRVGVGTATPAHSLDVSGTTRTTSLLTTAASGADAVTLTSGSRLRFGSATQYMAINSDAELQVGDSTAASPRLKLYHAHITGEIINQGGVFRTSLNNNPFRYRTVATDVTGAAMVAAHQFQNIGPALTNNNVKLLNISHGPDATPTEIAYFNVGGKLWLKGQLESAATGTTPPLIVASSALVTNLNADMLDGLHATAFALTGHNHDTVYAPLVHSHNDLYYTETEADARFALTHTHPYAPIAHVGSSGDTQHAVATTTVAGFMSTADKTKLDGIAAGANNYVLPVATSSVLGGVVIATAAGLSITAGGVLSANVQTVAGKTGAVTLTSSDVGLGNVENKSSATIRSEITSSNVTTALGYTPENPANKNAANGYAGLDSGGKISTSVLPAIAITDTFVVASQAAQLALTAEVGDLAVRTDINKTFILRVAGASTLANWEELRTPTDSVTSVNGMTGVVVVSTITGNAGTATALQTARTIALTGAVTGSGSFDGSANLSIATTVAHNHDDRYYTETESNTLFAPAGHVGAGNGAHAVVTTTANGFMAFADKVKLDGIAAGATNYTHPASHPPSIITQDASNRFVTDAEKTTWNGKQNALGYTPVNKAGDTGVGATGFTGLVTAGAGVRASVSPPTDFNAPTAGAITTTYSTNTETNRPGDWYSVVNLSCAAGTATRDIQIASVYGAANTDTSIRVRGRKDDAGQTWLPWRTLFHDGNLSAATTSVTGLMSSADKTKLDNVAAGATANTGTVTSVGLSLPGIFTITVSPITTSGTLTATLATQTAKTFFAAPTAGGTPTFRTILTTDLPDLSATYQPKDGDLSAIAALSTTGFLKRTGADSWTLDGSTYLTANQTITLSGDVVTATGTTTLTATLKDVVTAGTKAKITYNAKGLVTAGADLAVGDLPVINDTVHGSRGGGTLHAVAVGGASPAAGFMSGTDKVKLDDLSNYLHPDNHPASMITTDATRSFITEAERTTWNAKSDAHSHPYAPIAHVGAGGAEHPLAVANGANGFLSGADKAKLDSMAAGAGTATISTVTANAAAGAAQYILVNASAGAVTISLPAAASSSGKIYTIKKIDSSFNVVTIDGNASETIDGVTSIGLIQQYESVQIVCDGTSWYIV